MKKRIKLTRGILIFAILAPGAAFGLQGNTSLLLSKALAQIGDTDSTDFVMWQKPVGVTPTQVIRISLAKWNLREEHPISYRCVVLDQAGVVIFQSPTQTVMVGDFNSVDVSYDNLNTIAEPVTGRKQVMLRVIESPRARKSSNIVGALEIINEDGTTATYDRFGNFL